MKNDLQRHKKSDGVKWFAVLLAVVLLAVSVTAAITSGFKNWNPWGWLDKKAEQPETPTTGGAYDENGESMESDKVYPFSSRMAFSSPSALSNTASEGIKLHATVKPDTATNKNVDWSISFVNASSAWATGKTVTDYVTVAPEASGSTTATVTCLAAFGEQIKITVTSQENATHKAECTVDFMKKFSDFTVLVDDGGGNNGLSYDAKSKFVKCSFSNPFFGIEYNSVFTDYTVEDTYSFAYKIVVSQAFSETEQGNIIQDYLFEGTSVSAAFIISPPVALGALKEYSANYKASGLDLDFPLTVLFHDFAEQNKAVFNVIVSVTSATTKEVKSFTYDLGFTLATLPTSVTGVELNDNDLVF